MREAKTSKESQYPPRVVRDQIAEAQRMAREWLAKHQQ